MCRSWRRGTTNMSMIHCAYVSGKFRSANATKSAGTIFDLELYRAAIDSRARAILATESRIVLFGFSLRFGFFHSFFFSLPLLLHHLLLALCCFLSFSLLETKQRDRKKERKNWEWVWAPTECCVCGWVGWWWGSWGSRAMWGRGLVPAVVAFKLSARQMEWIILAQAHGKLLDAPLFPARRVISQYKWIIAIASTSWQCDWFGK